MAGVGRRAAEGIGDERDLGFLVEPHLAAVFLDLARGAVAGDRDLGEAAHRQLIRLAAAVDHGFAVTADGDIVQLGALGDVQISSAADVDIARTAAVFDENAGAKGARSLHRTGHAAVVDVKFAVGADCGGDRRRARVERHVVAGVGRRTAEGVGDERDLGLGVVPHIAAAFHQFQPGTAARNIGIGAAGDGDIAGNTALIHIEIGIEYDPLQNLSGRYDDSHDSPSL